MSFILDALKKSETDRQRQGGPALFEVKVAPPRSALPPWAVAIAVLFVANLALIGYLLLRHSPAAASAVPPVTAAAAAAANASTPPATATTATPGAAPGSGAALSAPAAQSAAAPSLTRGVPPGPALDANEDLPGAAGRATSPDDYAPAAEAPPPGNSGRVKRGTDAGVPLYQQLATSPNSQLPQLRLDLHAYAERADDRWVMINMHKLHEGESLEGVRVERITPDGAVLSWQGSQFLLTQE
jgi:general secretion pathway protein B